MPRISRLAELVRSLLSLRLPVSDETQAELRRKIETLRIDLTESADFRTEEVLQDRLGLSGSEMYALLVLAAIATDRECAMLATSGGTRPMTRDLLEEIVSGRFTGTTLTAENGALRKFGLIERADAKGDVHLSQWVWTISDRALDWLSGDGGLDSALAELVVDVRNALPLDHLAIEDRVRASAAEAIASKNSLVVVSGAPGLGRRTLLVASAIVAGNQVVTIETERFSKDEQEFVRQVRLIVRECRLLRRIPLLRNIDALSGERDARRLEFLGRAMSEGLETNILVTCGVNRPQLRWDRPVIAIELKPPTSAQRAKLWRQLLTDASESDGEYLATQYPLAPAVMHRAAQAALARATGRKVTPDDITAGIRAVLDDRLGNFAKRVEVTQTWDDLVIEHEQAQAITELIARIRQRRTVYEQWGFAAKVGKGLGVSALFSGPPGTGKTMVAALIARELGLELYQVDMGKLVSKWIGETEKQLGEMFDAAEAGHAILLFDEADSLFGKRTEVRSSNDRYANLETNYLLQRLESFTGICVLTTNHESNIDPAFQRRLSLHLRFNVPDEDEREKLWRAMLPAAAPVEPNVDFTGLARRFAMTGGYIRNAALRAAFLAADEGVSIGSAHLEHAARLEYEGMGKIVTPPSTWPSRLSSAL